MCIGFISALFPMAHEGSTWRNLWDVARTGCPWQLSWLSCWVLLSVMLSKTKVDWKYKRISMWNWLYPAYFPFSKQLQWSLTTFKIMLHKYTTKNTKSLDKIIHPLSIPRLKSQDMTSSVHLFLCLNNNLQRQLQPQREDQKLVSEINVPDLYQTVHLHSLLINPTSSTSSTIWHVLTRF